MGIVFIAKLRYHKVMKKIQDLAWGDYEKELLKKPGFKEAQKETELEYQVARAIIKARLEKGLTQATLAKKLHTTQSVVSRVESGKSLPSLSFLKRLAETLNASLHVEFRV